jgi:cellobiose phosphorylase
MDFGHFDDQNREYVITNPATPWPWINYLGNEDFFSLISNTAGGYSFYKDAKFRRITRYRYNGVPMDNGGRYFYINDNGTVWNPGWKPCKTPLDFYECRHGMNYTKIKGAKNGVEAEVLFFVPLKTWAEVQKVTLRNTTSAAKTIEFVHIADFAVFMLLVLAEHPGERERHTLLANSIFIPTRIAGCHTFTLLQETQRTR